jgi:hypothetical protein
MAIRLKLPQELPIQLEAKRNHTAEHGKEPGFLSARRTRLCLAASGHIPEWEASVGELKQRLVMPLEYSKGRAVFRQTQGQTAGMLDHSCRNADDFLHHSADAPQLGTPVPLLWRFICTIWAICA